jgi:CHAD domain-containing protein
MPSAEKELGAYLEEHAAALVAHDIAVDPDAETVHDVRVAARRIRSVARVFGDVLDPGTAGHVETELAWYQDLLGALRDAQLQCAHLLAAVDGLDPSDVRGPVRERITVHLAAEQNDAHHAVIDALQGARYRILLADVASFAERPPLQPGAAGSDLRDHVTRAQGKAARRLRSGLRADDTVLLHRARKATKRARYATESVRESLGEGEAAVAIERYKRILDVLGAYQDAVVTIALLHDLADRASQGGEDDHTYRVLAHREEEICRSARDAARQLSV